jgi:hypothetical protein
LQRERIVFVRRDSAGRDRNVKGERFDRALFGFLGELGAVLQAEAQRSIGVDGSADRTMFHNFAGNCGFGNDPSGVKSPTFDRQFENKKKKKFGIKEVFGGEHFPKIMIMDL